MFSVPKFILEYSQQTGKITFTMSFEYLILFVGASKCSAFLKIGREKKSTFFFFTYCSEKKNYVFCNFLEDGN